LQHKRSAAEVLAIALQLTREAVASAIAQLDQRARGLKQNPLPGDVPVLTYAELATGLDLTAFGADLARSDLDLPTRSLRVTQEAWRLSGRAGPAVVLGFGSIPYQAVTLDDDALRRRLIAAAGPDVNPIGYFPGISDMSFLGRGTGGLETAAANTPIWATSFRLDPSPGYPIVNIGPWGRDYHHWLERLNAPFAFAVLPGLVQRAARAGCEAD